MIGSEAEKGGRLAAFEEEIARRQTYLTNAWVIPAFTSTSKNTFEVVNTSVGESDDMLELRRDVQLNLEVRDLGQRRVELIVSL